MLQNAVVNLESLSVTIFRGAPWSLQMLSKNSRATSAPPAFPYFRGIRWTRLVNLSVTVKMLSYPAAVVGRLTIKSIVIVSHFLFGILKGFNEPFGLAVETLDI